MFCVKCITGNFHSEKNMKISLLKRKCIFLFKLPSVLKSKLALNASLTPFFFFLLTEFLLTKAKEEIKKEPQQLPLPSFQHGGDKWTMLKLFLVSEKGNKMCVGERSLD